jgi:hypothetical protein
MVSRLRTPRRVGGGLLKSVELLDQEVVIAQSEAEKKFSVPFWTSWGGALFLTSERLIYLPTWLFIPAWFERPDILLLDDIDRVRRLNKPSYLWGGYSDPEKKGALFGPTLWWIFHTRRREARFSVKDKSFVERLRQVAHERGWQVHQDRG